MRVTYDRISMVLPLSVSNCLLNIFILLSADEDENNIFTVGYLIF